MESERLPDKPPPFRVAIVGGGTAGWLSALILQEAARRHEMAIDLSVIESSKIPTIGVGEGTTAVFRGLLQQLGYDEAEFIRETGATIKFGIRHMDWRRPGHHYDGPIDDPHLVCQTPPGITTSWLNQYCVASGRSVTEPHLFSWLMDKSRAPFAFGADGRLIPVGPFHHAYHFDQALVGAWLRRKAHGIHHIDAIVQDAKRDPTSGEITALLLEEQNDIPVDFVIDCTGFRRAIIGEKMGAKWQSYSDRLPVNRAIPFWLDHSGKDIAPYTLARAMNAGWMWQIPTQDRIGAGYVFSDAHISAEEAQKEVETLLGHPVEPRNNIPINSGHLDRPWIGNCLATGLAQSFFEPLEATSIHGTIVQMLLFSHYHLPKVIRSEDTEIANYNTQIARQADDFCTFINLHYVTERDDTAFWRDVRRDFIGVDTQSRLKLWSKQMPRRSDFTAFPGGLAHIEEQLYYPVLDGLGLLSKSVAKEELAGLPKLRAHARKTNETLRREFRRAANKAPSHREFLLKIKEQANVI